MDSTKEKALNDLIKVLEKKLSESEIYIKRLESNNDCLTSKLKILSDTVKEQAKTLRLQFEIIETKSKTCNELEKMFLDLESLYKETRRLVRR